MWEIIFESSMGVAKYNIVVHVRLIMYVHSYKCTSISTLFGHRLRCTFTSRHIRYNILFPALNNVPYLEY